jgi:DNA-binding transcriptional MocR family regulator
MTIWTPQLQSGQPIYLSIADALARDIKKGTLPPGTKLPPQRDLAWRLKVTLGTVTRAYKEAEIRGLLSGEVGRGSYVRGTAGPAPIAPRPDEASTIADLSHAVPPPVYLHDEFDAALAYVMREPSRLGLLDYTPSEGHAHYLAMGVKWLKRSGIDVAEDDLIMTPGAYLGIVACLSALTQPGDGVMAEALNYTAMRPIMQRHGLAARPLEMTPQGLDLVSLERMAKEGQARILYIVPTLQNPTTVTMPRERRDAIVDIARRYNLTIIEDDLFRLLDDRLQPPTFYELAPERTYHITSLSKSLAPGLRIGFVATPKGQAQLLKAQQKSAGARVTGLTAEMARYWIETDIAGNLLSRVVAELGERRRMLCETFVGTSFMCEPGAPYAWVNLPPQWSGRRFAATALTRNVKVSPGAAFALTAKTHDRAIRVCFGQPATRDALRAALMKIRELMSEVPEDDFTPMA